MQRRTFLASALYLGGLPAAAMAQAPRRFRVGWVTNAPTSFTQPFLAEFRAGLRERGYIEGDNLLLEIRENDGDPERLPGLVGDLASRGVDVIMTVGNATRAVIASAAAPVVFVFSADPVEAGLSQSLARPSGNCTGITLMSVELNGKRLELLRQVRPDLRRTAIIASPDHAGEHLEREDTETMARRLGIAIDYFPVHSRAELEASLTALAAGAAEAIVAFSDPITVGNRDRIIAAAMARRIPVISGWAVYARSGALCTYGPKLEASYRRAAYFVDRLLKGAKPGELPIERPTTFELVVNLKTAQALGVTVPAAVLARADELIED